MSPELYIGMMSGTSADGVDASLVKFEHSRAFTVIDNHFEAFPRALRIAVNNIGRCADLTDDVELKNLDEALCEIYVKTVHALLDHTDITIADVTAIANHGQTVRHEPNANPPRSIQLGAPQRLAQQLERPVISHFRQGDLEVGGQGAPLMPAFHAHCLDNAEPSAIINIGGIANVTLLNVGPQPIGFDTGPGNTLMDQWIEQHEQQAYDKEGAWARSGTVNKPLLAQLLEDPYFAKAYPKSTGPDFFNLAWLEQIAGDQIKKLTAKDVQATLTELTAISIARSLELPEDTSAFLCGGGAHNRYLIERLEHHCPTLNVATTADRGLPPDWVESVGFAWLGYCHRHGIKSNLPSVTGAQKAVVLGELYLP